MAKMKVQIESINSAIERVDNVLDELREKERALDSGFSDLKAELKSRKCFNPLTLEEGSENYQYMKFLSDKMLILEKEKSELRDLYREVSSII